MFDLSSYLPYLLNRAGSRIVAAFTREARKHGINLQMWRVLAALHEHDGESVSGLAALTSIEISTLSRVLDQMQAQRLISRERQSGNQRSVSVRRTATGRAITEKLIPTALEFERIALEGFSARDQAALKAMLARVYDNIGQIDVRPRRIPAGKAARPLRRAGTEKAGEAGAG